VSVTAGDQERVELERRARCKAEPARARLIVDGRAAEAAQLMQGHITHSLTATATAISVLEDREGIRGT
jgi:hypothetical protein